MKTPIKLNSLNAYNTSLHDAPNCDSDYTYSSCVTSSSILSTSTPSSHSSNPNLTTSLTAYSADNYNLNHHNLPPPFQLAMPSSSVSLLHNYTPLVHIDPQIANLDADCSLYQNGSLNLEQQQPQQQQLKKQEQKQQKQRILRHTMIHSKLVRPTKKKYRIISSNNNILFLNRAFIKYIQFSRKPIDHTSLINSYYLPHLSASYFKEFFTVLNFHPIKLSLPRQTPIYKIKIVLEFSGPSLLYYQIPRKVKNKKTFDYHIEADLSFFKFNPSMPSLEEVHAFDSFIKNYFINNIFLLKFQKCDYSSKGWFLVDLVIKSDVIKIK